MNYPEEWLKTLKYYRANWENIVYPFTYKRTALSAYHAFKQMIKSIPFFGPIIQKHYQKHFDYRAKKKAGSL
jgi:hypothetical protein